MNPLGALLRSWPAYEAGLRQRGSLTVWFTDEAIEAWAAEPRTTRSREWLVEKHGTRTRRSWRKLHLGIDADTGQIVAVSLTAKEVDDGAEVGALLDQVDSAVAAFTADGGYDQDGVSAAIVERYPRGGNHCAAARNCGAERNSRDRAHAARPPPPVYRRAWPHGLAETLRLYASSAGRGCDRALEQVIGDGLHSHKDDCRTTEVKVAVHALNRMLELGRPKYVRAA